MAVVLGKDGKPSLGSDGTIQFKKEKFNYDWISFCAECGVIINRHPIPSTSKTNTKVHSEFLKHQPCYTGFFYVGGHDQKFTDDARKFHPGALWTLAYLDDCMEVIIENEEIEIILNAVKNLQPGRRIYIGTKITGR